MAGRDSRADPARIRNVASAPIATPWTRSRKSRPGTAEPLTPSEHVTGLQPGHGRRAVRRTSDRQAGATVTRSRLRPPDAPPRVLGRPARARRGRREAPVNARRVAGGPSCSAVAWFGPGPSCPRLRPSPLEVVARPADRPPGRPGAGGPGRGRVRWSAAGSPVEHAASAWPVPWSSCYSPGPSLPPGLRAGTSDGRPPLGGRAPARTGLRCGGRGDRPARRTRSHPDDRPARQENQDEDERPVHLGQANRTGSLVFTPRSYRSQCPRPPEPDHAPRPR